MAKRIFGIINLMASIVAIAFCFYIIITGNFDFDERLFILLMFFTVSVSNIIYVLRTKFHFSMNQLNATRVYFIPLQIIGLIITIAGLVSMIITIINLGYIVDVFTSNDSEIIGPFAWMSIIFLSFTFVYPLLTRFWHSTKKDIKKPIEYFKVGKNLIFPIKTAKILIIFLLLLIIIHKSFFSEKRYTVNYPHLKGITESEYLTYLRDHENKSFIINNASVEYRGGLPVNSIYCIYFGYFVIFSAAVYFAKIIPIKDEKEIDNQELKSEHHD